MCPATEKNACKDLMQQLTMIEKILLMPSKNRLPESLLLKWINQVNFSVKKQNSQKGQLGPFSLSKMTKLF